MQRKLHKKEIIAPRCFIGAAFIQYTEVSMDYYKESLKLHEKHKGKLAVVSKVPLKNKDDLSIAYTPGVAEPSREIHRDPDLVYKYTAKGSTVAVISDGSAVLGMGNIGGKAAIPIMEGKAVLFKAFADIDAIPICLETQDTEEIIQIVKNIVPTLGASIWRIYQPRAALRLKGDSRNWSTSLFFTTTTRDGHCRFRSRYQRIEIHREKV